jgi:hypothetical protein
MPDLVTEQPDVAAMREPRRLLECGSMSRFAQFRAASFFATSRR